MTDQSAWPAHLRDDAPFARCDGCGRSTWAESEFGQVCDFPQPDGDRCQGRFSDPRVDDQLRHDRAVFGVSFIKIARDGSRERIDPRSVRPHDEGSV